jgi:hypothetical protein
VCKREKECEKRKKKVVISVLFSGCEYGKSFVDTDLWSH